MHNMKSLFVGIFVLTVLGWAGMILVPFYQLGQLEPHMDEDSGLSFPLVPTGEVIAGEKVYLAQGCVYCHSQQVRATHQGADLHRGWGNRRSVARDYIFKASATMGDMRLGPDLSNVGSDQRIIKTFKLYEDERFADKEWQWETQEQRINNSVELRAEYSDEEWAAIVKDYEKYLFNHLYDPRGLHKWSLMPSFRGLFKEIPAVGQPSAQAVNSKDIKEGYQAVPGPEAEALVAYLMSLDQSYALPEATQ